MRVLRFLLFLVTLCAIALLYFRRNEFSNNNITVSVGTGEMDTLPFERPLMKALNMSKTEFYKTFVNANTYIRAKNIKTQIYKRNQFPFVHAETYKRRSFENEILFTVVEHKKYIPRLKVKVTSMKFAATFMKTSTPVVIPSEIFREFNIDSINTWQKFENRFSVVKEHSFSQNKETFGYLCNRSGDENFDIGPALKELKKLDAKFKNSPDSRTLDFLSDCKEENGGRWCLYPRNMKTNVVRLESNLGIRTGLDFFDGFPYESPTISMIPSNHNTLTFKDKLHSFFVNVFGQIELILVPSIETNLNLGTFPFCIVGRDVCKADSKNQSEYKSVRELLIQNFSGIAVDLYPGDILFIPRDWFYRSYSKEISLIANFRLMKDIA